MRSDAQQYLCDHPQLLRETNFIVNAIQIMERAKSYYLVKMVNTDLHCSYPTPHTYVFTSAILYAYEKKLWIVLAISFSPLNFSKDSTLSYPIILSTYNY